MKQYDYLIVGAGLTGCIFAHFAAQAGKTCLVIDKREHLGGNCYTKQDHKINVHVYGAHIFHTSNKAVWDFVNRFATFNNYVNSPIANFHGEIYNLPFNMNTFSKMWGIKTPQEAKEIIDEQRKRENISEPKNLEEQALSLVGRDIYEKLIKEYTQKQWGRKCTDLPSFIIKRLPVRFVYDNNYFNDIYQGIPIGGYTQIFEKLLDVDGIDVKLGCSFDYVLKLCDIYTPADYTISSSFADLESAPLFSPIAKKLVYTGPIDEYFNFKLGKLDYRTVKFETEVLEGVENYQGNAVVNFTSSDEPYTRIIEHKHFEFARDIDGNLIEDTIISKEYSKEFEEGDEPYYPVNDDKNSKLFTEYQKLADGEKNVIFAGRLGAYKYYDMAPCIEAAFKLVEQEIAIKCA